MKGPGIAELIDLEVQLRADADLAPEELHARDGAIGTRIGAADLDDRSATLRWLAEVRGPEGPGTRAEQRRNRVSAGLLVLGFLLGALSVGGWLATGTREPVNVVYFWPGFIGSQIVLALGFLIAAVPARAFGRVPLVGTLHSLMRSLAGAAPRLMARGLARISRGAGERWTDTLAEIHRLDWLYGRLRFWLLAQMTQLFAVAFNVGALFAFVVLPTIDDPAFGWRSRLLDERQVEAASAAVAWPWHAVWPEAVPSGEVIAATRYSSVAQRYLVEDAPSPDATGHAQRPWAAWWPFLVASAVCYGLAPRLLYWMLSGLGVRRALRRISFDRGEIARLCHRMRWPLLQTAGIGDEASRAWPADGERAAGPAWPLPERARALCFPGVDVDDTRLAEMLAERFGAAPVATHPVGDIGGRGDEVALAALDEAPPGEGVYVVVEAWEPPVGDHLDLLDAVRSRGGETRPILVVLHGWGADGRPDAPETRHRSVWERAIRRRGDPRMSVAPLVEHGVGGSA